VISAASFHTGNPSRDVTVRSARLLDTGAYPGITFISRRLDQADGRWVLHGLLSVRGRAHPVELLIEEAQPAGRDLRLRASVRLDRYDFGITTYKGLAARNLGFRLDIVAHRL
jgi:polyisoprenoid-binding protein YceI